MRSFVKIKSSRNAEITQSFTDIGISCPSRDFSVTNMSFKAIREDKILAKNFRIYNNLNTTKIRHVGVVVKITLEYTYGWVLKRGIGWPGQASRDFVIKK